MRLGTVKLDEGTRAFRQDETGTYYFPHHADIGEVLRSQDWREFPLEQGEAPEADALTMPILRPSKIICAGLNYYAHAEEVGKTAPDVPTLFSKVATSLVSPRGDIHLPPLSTQIDWEGELVVVIGNYVKNANAEIARESILGYTVINDLSVRDWQRRTSEWFQGKNFDESSPLGPVIVTADEVDPQKGLSIQTRVNGVLEQDGTTADLIFSPVDLVMYISQFLTLEPGDLIATGTPAGVGTARKPPLYLRDGDVLNTSIEGIGELTNIIRIGDLDQEI
ncbi:fumarylacetoacetate hydrolase family protein [Leucobacter sp. W1038]|uniref:fumarylacetoacetate hydrolase family protein n=1 Tax=Leucobacter sp. W1038 TaxID=3438281 RepID=UPI003D967204